MHLLLHYINPLLPRRMAQQSNSASSALASADPVVDAGTAAVTNYYSWKGWGGAKIAPLHSDFRTKDWVGGPSPEFVARFKRAISQCVPRFSIARPLLIFELYLTLGGGALLPGCSTQKQTV